MQLSYFERLATLIESLKQEVSKVGQLHSFELVGGNTRVPSVISIAEEIFGMSHSRTLNSDECMSEGAAVACAMESPC
jgi:molecular chaperone DnaK (HSP70)